MYRSHRFAPGFCISTAHSRETCITAGHQSRHREGRCSRFPSLNPGRAARLRLDSESLHIRHYCSASFTVLSGFKAIAAACLSTQRPVGSSPRQLRSLLPPCPPPHRHQISRQRPEDTTSAKSPKQPCMPPDLHRFKPCFSSCRL